MENFKNDRGFRNWVYEKKSEDHMLYRKLH